MNHKPNLFRACVEALESRRLLTALTIAQENQLPGTPQSQWDIVGIGDPGVQGFATDISVNRGNTVQFKIDDPPLVPYHLDIYRMGYYQGNGARLVTTIPAAQTQSVDQPNPLTDATTGLVDCGNWQETASWSVPADATSGIYFARVVRDDTGGASHIVFVVRDDAGSSQMIMQTSDATWEAYNQWGGNSLYVGTGPGGGPAPGRAYKVSYNRPFNNRAQPYGYGPQSWVFYIEYPTVRFLEQNGYDVSYQSSVDTDRFGSLLTNHKVFISVGHDEYWSGGQRAAVEAARDAGTNLAFFSGNLMFWKTRYENSLDSSHASYRTLVCYKESLVDAKIDPSPIWTGLWRDARFSPPSDGGRPENATTGGFGAVDRGPNDIGTSFDVPDWAGQFRLWRNTSLATLSNGAIAHVGDSVLGYEWDIDLDNGVRPVGLIDLSNTRQAVSSLLDYYAHSEAPGIATHNVVMYRAPSGALVFNAATVQWVWGLDAQHDGKASDGHAPAADSRMQQATVNLFADMGVQPETLMAGLTPATQSSDAKGPIVSIAVPPNNTVISQGGFATITGTAIDSGGVVAGIEVSIDGGATWHPAVGRGAWSFSWEVTQAGTASIRVRGTDDSANTGAVSSATVSIELGSGTSIWNNSVVPGTLNDPDVLPVEVGLKFKSDVDGLITGLRFFKGSLNNTVHVGHLWTLSGELLATETFTDETSSGWQTVSLSQPVSITANTTYIASYFTDVGHYSSDNGYFLGGGVDHAPLHALSNAAAGGNGVYHYGASGFPDTTFQGSNYWVDVVFLPSPVDNTPPQVNSTVPASGATGVAASTTVKATFNEAIQTSTLSFVLRDSSNNVVAANLTYDSATFTATLTPTSSLAAGGRYTATISASDLAGNAMPAPVVWSFTVFAPIVDQSLFPASAVPGAASVSDVNAVELGVKFRSDVAGTIAAVRLYKGLFNTGTHVGTLWTIGGTLLSRVTFANETASGWQTARFATPVAITANTIYIVSYHTNVGRYAADNNYFATRGVDSGALHAPISSGVGGNGVYVYGPNSAFPTNSYLATNYWVDVIFNASAPDTTPPTITAQSPLPGAINVSRSTAITATFSEPMQAGTISFVLKNSGGATVAATLSYDPVTRVATLTPSTQLAASTTYTATVSNGQDLSGNVMLPVSWSFTTSAVVDTTPPTIIARSPAINARAVSRAIRPTITFSEAMNPATINTSTVQLLRGNTVVAASVAYDTVSHIATITPSALLASNTKYTVRVVGGSAGVKDVAGNAMTSTQTWTFTTGTSTSLITLIEPVGMPIGGDPVDLNPSDPVDSGDPAPATIQSFGNEPMQSNLTMDELLSDLFADSSGETNLL